MVSRIFLTFVLKNVLMWISGSAMCSPRTLTQQGPMPQKLHPSKPAVRSLHQFTCPRLAPYPLPLPPPLFWYCAVHVWQQEYYHGNQK